MLFPGEPLTAEVPLEAPLGELLVEEAVLAVQCLVPACHGKWSVALLEHRYLPHQRHSPLRCPLPPYTQSWAGQALEVTPALSVHDPASASHVLHELPLKLLHVYTTLLRWRSTWGLRVEHIVRAELLRGKPHARA